MREVLARWLCPDVFAERDRLWGLWNRVTQVDRWCAEFSVLDQALAWCLEVRDYRRWEDISGLRDRLRALSKDQETGR